MWNIILYAIFIWSHFYFYAVILCTEDEHYETENPISLSGVVGGNIIMDCDIAFPHDVIIPYVLHWLKDGEQIYSWSEESETFSENFANRIHMLPEDERSSLNYGRGAINLTSIRETDDGWYECRILFPTRTPSTKGNGTWFHLEIKGENFLAIPPTNETVLEGSPVQLLCITKNPSANVSWYKDNVKISQVADLRDRVRQSPEGSLTISPTDMKDSGYFYCQVSLGNEKQVAGAFLDVQYPAKIVYAPKITRMQYGKSGNLKCHFKANPDMTKIRWEKDGLLFDPYNVPGVFLRKNRTLFFSKVDETHAGDYTCTPYNDLGSEGPSPRMKVVVQPYHNLGSEGASPRMKMFVQKPPIFTLVPHVLYIRKIGDSVSIPCDAADSEDDEKSSIQWFKRDGTELPTDRFTISGGNLTIVNIEEQDRGVYRCIVANEEESITSEMELVIDNAPLTKPACNISTNVSETSIDVKWMPEFIKSELDYSVWYRLVGNSEWRMIKLNKKDSMEVKIQDLSPGRKYEIMVLSQDAHGDRIFSKSIQIHTKGKPIDDENQEKLLNEFRNPVGSFEKRLYEQIGPPHDIYVEIVSEGYRVLWKEPKYGKEMIKYYMVIWCNEYTDELVGSQRTMETQATITDLIENETYRIQVSAMSVNDYESYSVKYIYRVPSSQNKLIIFFGSVTGVFLVTFIILAVRFFNKSNNKDAQITK